MLLVSNALLWYRDGSALNGCAKIKGHSTVMPVEFLGGEIHP